MQELSANNYDENIQDAARALILVYKDECPHCMNIKKVINKYLSVTKDELPIFAVNSEKESSIMEKLDAELVPTTCLMKNGELAFAKRGLYNYKELKVFVKENL